MEIEASETGETALPPCVPLPRVATWEEWEQGRAFRRALSLRVNGGRSLRRTEGDPRKDALLRQLFAGERGMPFQPPDRIRP